MGMQQVDILRGHDVVTVNPGTTVREAARAMTEAHIGCVPVVDDHNKPIGILTERDLMDRVITPGLDIETLTVAAIMTPDPVTVRDGTDMAHIEEIMERMDIRHVPVVDGNGVLVAIVSQRDVARRLADVLRALENRTRLGSFPPTTIAFALFLFLMLYSIFFVSLLRLLGVVSAG